MNIDDIDFCDIFYKLGNYLKNNDIKLIVENDQTIFNNCCIVDYVEEDNTGNVVYNGNKIYDNLDNYNNTIIFNIDVFLDQILKSYKYDKNKIWDQFMLDLPRTNISVNSTHIVSLNQFKSLLDQYSKLTTIVSSHNYDCLTMLTMLCNQSSYALPYIYLYQLYNDGNCMLSCLPSNRNVVFHLDEKIKYVSLEADFAVKDISSNIVLRTINVLMKIDLFINDQLFNNHGTFIWINI